ncbi:flavin reductase family protein [Streptomyces sp. SM11]|uniref:flavin reductase family protein n=1 Tax=Streptomyces sp. SM11 TaxID=565557 RepID=UPI00215667EC|nr:flavin reductase family protein [Streptomyces sp. SM11]
MVTERDFKDLMADVCTPVAVVTAMADGLPHGTTVGSLTSLSLRPPMVTVALEHRSRLLPKILGAERFGVNLLGAGQAGVARAFASSAPDRFEEADWCLDDGLPRLREAPGWLGCHLQRYVVGGDHLLLLGLVTRVAGTRAVAPLVYGRRTFGTHSAFAQENTRSITDHIAAFAH